MSGKGSTLVLSLSKNGLGVSAVKCSLAAIIGGAKVEGQAMNTKKPDLLKSGLSGTLTAE